jgi:5-methyltetrahydropteroyltriglutamate--homocysteine methyltransferase
MNNVKTAVIGSYPVDINNTELMNDYFEQKNVSWNKYIDFAVNDMISSGIDIISDGQTRDSFINIFTRKLRGCRIRDRAEIIDKVEYIGPITIEDQKYVKSKIPKKTQLVGVITGPYTLTKSSIDQFYNNEKNLAFDFAHALKQEVSELQKYVDLISIDEPYFSVDFPEYGKKLISIITKDLTCPTRLHVCGDVSNIAPELLEMPVNILSHEFKALPKLFNSYEKYDISKNICLGAVCSDNIKIETVEEIICHIKKGIQVFGNKIIQLAPDCGLRLLPRNVAFQKLKNLAIAKEKIYGE